MRPRSRAGYFGSSENAQRGANLSGLQIERRRIRLASGVRKIQVVEIPDWNEVKVHVSDLQPGDHQRDFLGLEGDLLGLSNDLRGSDQMLHLTHVEIEPVVDFLPR